MDSLSLKSSRYVAGGISERASGKIEWWERTIFPQDSTDTHYVIENFYAGRLDLIANAFYKEPRYWWVIAQINNILDPITETVPGRTLIIPSPERLNAMLNKKMGGVDSKRIPVTEISPIVS